VLESSRVLRCRVHWTLFSTRLVHALARRRRRCEGNASANTYEAALVIEEKAGVIIAEELYIKGYQRCLVVVMRNVGQVGQLYDHCTWSSLDRYT
jgi:hypothetical protein